MFQKRELLSANNRNHGRAQHLPQGRARRAFWLKITFVIVFASVGGLGSCAKPAAFSIVRQNFQTPQDSPKILAVYMPWFGAPGHIDVGYSSHDSGVLRRQIEAARGIGISAFVVDWYGERRPFLDESFRLLQRAAKEKHFQVALMYDETEDNDGNATEDAITALLKAYTRYIGPEAPDRDAYLTYNGRPIIVIFPKRGHTNWNLVRERVSTWAAPPLLFYKDEPPAEFATAFDGYYAWVQPGEKGWTSNGSDWGEQYLETFYKNMKNKNPGKIAMGAAWPGFDDTQAPWSLNRHMDARCGKTFADTLQLYRRYYDNSAPLPFLLIETWNDYEEGTAIEHPKSGNCAANTSERQSR